MRPALVAVGCFAAFSVACQDKNISEVNVVTPIVSTNRFVQTNLVADIAGTGAVTIDPNLINSWGIAFGASGALWVANNGSGTATVYNANGTSLGITVTIPGAGTPIATPAAAGGPKGKPTGIVFNTTASDFVIPNAGAAAFIIAGEDGTISAWNTTTGASSQIVVDNSAKGAVYKGIAIAVEGSSNRVYATNFKHNSVDVWDGNFAFVRSFTDSTAPAGFGPFGIAQIGNQLYVTYAKQTTDSVDDVAGAGNGFVDVFNPNGTIVRRFVTGGALNSPWGVTMATTGFGPFGGNILIGNFGDGVINAYDAGTGNFVDSIRDVNGNTIVIPGLWGLEFGPVSSSTTLFFASGPGSEAHGLVGTLARP